MKKIIKTIILLITSCTGAPAQIDPLEYPPGHPNVIPTATQQLQTFPSPRYKTGHTLLPNFNWIDPQWMGSRWQSGVSDAQAVTNSVDIQTAMVTNFNYVFMVSWNGDNFNTAWKNACNANPSYKVGLITLMAQAKGCGTKCCAWCECLSSNHYIQNSSGQFLDWNGNVTSVKTIRPTAPVASFAGDGNNARGYVSSALSNLTNTVDIVNENAEIWPMLEESALSKDPTVVAAKPAGMSFLDFHANGMRILDNAYRDRIMSLPQLAGAKYTEYKIDGHRTYNIRWEYMKQANSQINGQYYSTADFYVRYPNNWKDWQGPWHGLRWMTEARHYEIAAGDKLFSPFIAAGWDRNEELNVRPAQWNGLLKLNVIYGAEFFYSGFFNENFSQTNPPPNPKGYAWQAAIPSYAQAIASHAEDILRNGVLMPGDMVNNLHNPPIPYYQFNAGATNKIVAVRNSGSKYLITGTIQNSSNVINSTTIYSTATINLNGEIITFNIRRHGSTYVYENTNPKVFYQLDGWHQYEHPSRWSAVTKMEAELFDVSTGIRKSYLPNFPNLTSFKTVVALANNQTASYSITPKGTQSRYLFIKGSGSGSLTAKWDAGSEQSITMAGDGWYRVSLGIVGESNHALVIKSLGSHEIDSITVSTNINEHNITTNPCTLTANITGNTAVCGLASTVLSVNTATTYLWSTGATSQSITAGAGTYSVTITIGACSATDIETVVSNPVPSAVITSSNPNPCSGTSVTLSVSPNSYYDWSNGSTSQSTTVTTSGDYTCRVGNGFCEATSAPFTVTFITCNQCLAPTNLEINGIQTDRILVHWDVMTSAVRGYNIYYQEGAGTVKKVWKNPNDAIPNRKFIKDLKSGTSYTVWVSSLCANRTEMISGKITVTTKSIAEARVGEK